MKEQSAIAIKSLPPLSIPAKEAPRAIDTYSYKVGFEEGFVASGNINVGLPLFLCGVVMLVLACVMIMRHASRLMSLFCPRKAAGVCPAGSKKLLLALLPLVVCVSLAGCAAKSADPAPSVPLPPQTATKAEMQKDAKPDVAYAPVTYAEGAGGQYLVVDVPPNISDGASVGPRRDEPHEMAELLEMKGTEGKTTAANLLRPLAIREAAQLVTFQTAIAYRYKRLLESTERHATILDAAFDFSPLLMTEGAALIQPPVLTRSGASLRIEKPDTASSAETAYELLEPARFVAVAPHWREFLMAGAFPEPEKPNPAVLPKNDAERAIWRTAVREAWAQGLAEADQLFADNVARMTRQYRGIMLYHLLTAQRLLSTVGSASASLPLNASDSKLYIGQQVYRITAPSRFLTNVPDGPKRPKGKAKP